MTVEVRSLPRRLAGRDSEGHEPDGDGAALIPRHDVVRLHDALPIRRVGQRQTASLTRRAPGVRVPPRRLWPKLKWTTRRDVAPEGAGSSPAGNPVDITAGDLVISEGSYPSPGGFDPRTRHLWAGGATGGAAPLQGEGRGFDPRTVHQHDHADVAQRERHGAQTAASVGSNPTVSTTATWTWRNGSAPAPDAGGWRFEPSRPDPCEVVEPEPRLALTQELQVRSLASQPVDALALPATPFTSSCRPVAQTGVPSPFSGLLRVRVPPPALVPA